MATYEDFKQYKQRLADGICYQLYNILQDCHNRHSSLGFDALLQDVEKVNQKLRSHRFRIAIIGEFSRRKSTLVNALVGEEIQPVRAIACSGTITVLKHGKEKRVICYYKDGRVQEVPVEDYQNLVAISKEAARKYVSDELARSQIEEVVFEHPNLAFCRNGVEISDSPGLNEHPERESITRKLIQDADAVIFLLLASQILTQSERKLLQDVKQQLCKEKKDEAARNLFLVINKIDELDSEEDRQDVRDIVEEFVFGSNLIPQVRDRIHYISAKDALNARLTDNKNEEIQIFCEFIEAIKRFSVHERESLEIGFVFSNFFKVFNDFFDCTDTIARRIDDEFSKKELRKQKILEELGELAGISIKIINSTQEFVEKAKSGFLEKFKDSWKSWLSNLPSNLLSSSKDWQAKGENAYENPEQFVGGYVQYFKNDLRIEFEKWLTENKKLLEEYRQLLDSNIYLEYSILIRYGTLEKQPLFFENLDIDFALKKNGYNDIFDRVYYAIGLGNFLNLIKLDVFQIKNKVAKRIRRAVVKEGYKAFCSSSDGLYKSMELAVSENFLSQIKALKNSLQQEITSCEQQLERADRAYQAALQEYETEKAWLDQKRQELDRVRQELATLLNQLPQ